MSWVAERESRPWTERIMNAILRTGPIPQHVAFIMDGNRRFARKSSIDRQEGHVKGFDRLAKTLDWCLELGITEVTVYAFSIENFRRSQDEVDGLMALAKAKFERLLNERELLERHGVRVCVLGQLSLLPLDLQRVVARAMHLTRHNDRAQLNVCFSYTSREEMCAAMKECAAGVRLGLITHTDISERVLERCLYTGDSPPPDLLVRTSGEVRLSDFLLWQSQYSVLAFKAVLWPEFTVWDLYSGVLHYQTNYQHIQEVLREHAQRALAAERDLDLETLAADDLTSDDLGKQLDVAAAQRAQRVETFLRHVRCQKLKHIQELSEQYVPPDDDIMEEVAPGSQCVALRGLRIESHGPEGDAAEEVLSEHSLPRSKCPMPVL